MTDTEAGTLIRTARTSGNMLIAIGVISLIAGVLAIAYPDITLLVLAIITGVNIIVLGALALAEVFDDDLDTGSRVMAAIVGVLGIIAGLVVLRRPGDTLLVIILVLGVWLVVSGVIDLVRAIARRDQRGMRVLTGLTDLVLGILILAWPEISLKTLAILIGIGFIIRGAISIYVGWRARHVTPPQALAPA
jgi:uncharacterized membrane protein HdeD (DUF308 family)